MEKCDYCEKPKRIVSDMLSNGYRICNTCSIKSFDQKINELETMKQANEREREFNKMLMSIK